MENPKSKVIKSKSSNSAIPTKFENKRNKSESHKKKSKSNAEFQTLVVKKRGVYVQNKLTEINARGNDSGNETKTDEIQPIKPPRRPKPGSKGFLASVLTILSKSTTGTQYPDTAQKTQNDKNDSTHNNAVLFNTQQNINDKKGKIKKKVPKDPADSHPDVEIEKKKKPKYKSKVLNENKYQVDKFEVLQSKKEIVQTPSLYSERSYKEDMKLSDLPRLVKPESDEAKETNENNINTLIREVTEGRKVKEKKVKLVDPDPATLVSEHSVHKEDKRLYNFFVDLLETTFNVNAEFDSAPNITSAVSSKIALEMDESVARKLNVATEMYEDINQKPSKHFYCIRNDNNNWNDEKLIDYFQTRQSSVKTTNELPLKTAGRKRKMKSESFAYTRNKISPPQSQSVVVTQRKSFYKKNKKKDLLNILKEQLKMDHLSFEEPKNLYQALKVMAKNKRKQKYIRFDRSAKRTTEGFRPPECMLKRRKIISSKSSSKYESEYRRTTGVISQKFSEVSGYRKPTPEYSTDEEQSNHSLEVYGFDYEVPLKKRSAKKEVFMTYHSSPSGSGHDINDMLRFTDSGSSTTVRDFTTTVNY